MLKNTLVQCDRSHNKQQLIYISLFLMKIKYTLDEQLNESTCYALCFACAGSYPSEGNTFFVL